MTLHELSRYYKLHERLERNREMLDSLYAAAEPGSHALTGVPHASGVSDKVGNLVSEIDELKDCIDRLEVECWQEKRQLERKLGTIEGDQTRMIFRLRFIHCMTWGRVAEVIGGGNTEDSVKKICYRKLRTMQDN